MEQLRECAQSTQKSTLICMLKIRTGNHTLSVETDRYKNRKTYQECVCKSCKEQEIEDVHHVIVKCDGYKEMRKQKLSFMIDLSLIHI